jgi:hypothetical protein
MEEFIEVFAGRRAWLIGLGVAVGALILLGRGLRPLARGTIRGALAVSGGLQDIYAEAKAEQRAGRAKAERDQGHARRTRSTAAESPSTVPESSSSEAEG